MKIDPSDHRVLVVDDDPSTLRAVADILRAEGFEITALDDPREALDRIGRESFGVVIAGAATPGLDGLSLMRRAQLLQPGSARILLTELGARPLAATAIDQGEIHRFVTRPVEEVELRVGTRLACEHLQLRREVQRLRDQVRRQGDTLARLERQHPGITGGEGPGVGGPRPDGDPD